MQTLTYGSHPFQQQVDTLLERLDDDGGIRIACCEMSEKDCRAFIGELSDATALSVHQVDAGQLISDRSIETQGNLREVFDTTQGEPAILFFNKVDAFFDRPVEESEDVEARADKGGDALLPIDYLYDRMKAFSGIVVLSISSQENCHRIKQRDLDMIVSP